jgi:hypothetical protein
MRRLAAGGIALTLVLVAAAVQGRAGSSQIAPGTVATTRPPPVLANGDPPRRLPAVVRRFSRRPIIGAKRVRRGAPTGRCRRERGERVVTAWLSPDGLSVIYSNPRSHGPRACDFVRVGGRWRLCSFGVARSRDPARIARAGGALGLCNWGRRWRAFVWTPSSSRAAWALVERGGYWVAYPAAGMRLIRISGTEGIAGHRFRVNVVFLDARGRVVERRRVVGAVAG